MSTKWKEEKCTGWDETKLLNQVPDFYLQTCLRKFGNRKERVETTAYDPEDKSDRVFPQQECTGKQVLTYSKAY
eukprot:13871318-Ditylum_brightwellii.AAC.1